MEDPHASVVALRRALDARAAGWWAVRGDRLEQLAFDPAPDMAPEVAAAFRAATASVPLEPSGLGIVRAALGGETTVSLAADLPPDSGSGLWLRAFGAERSVAVPLLDHRGQVEAVLSVALPASCPLDAPRVADLLVRRRQHGPD